MPTPRPSKNRWLLLALVSVLLSLAAGCTRSFERSIAIASLDSGTHHEVLTYDHQSTWEHVEMGFRLTLRSGSGSAELRDPEGVVRWTQIFEGATSDRIRETYAAVHGTWTLTLRFDDARGRYRASIASR